MKAAIIFPHQLFKQNTFLHKVNRIYLVFEELFFHQFKFHKSKIAYHYAASNFYIDFLTEQGFSIGLIETKNIEEFREFFNQMKIAGINEICYYDTVDY